MNKLARKARAARALPLPDLAVVAEAWLTLTWVEALTCAAPWVGMRALLRRAATPPLVPVGDDIVPARLLKLFAIAARNHVRPPNCLRRALSQYLLLSRRGVRTTLVIGTRVQPDGLSAHAWLERGATVINDHADVRTRYHVLERPAPAHLQAELIASR